MEFVAIKGEARADLGKKSARASRKEGLIPCVMYGGDQVIHFTTTHNQVKNLVYTPAFKVAKVEVDGESIDCILKDIQFHPVTDEIMHIDFLRLVEGNPVKFAVPVKFIGTAEGVKTGGKLQQNVRRIKIKTAPEHMVNELELDVSHLEMGQSIRIRDIKVGEEVEILQSPGIPIATVVVPRSMRSATAAADKLEGEEAEGAEGEESTEEGGGEE